MRGVCVFTYVYITCLWEKKTCDTQKTGVAQGHFLFEKRKGKMTKRNGLRDRVK